MTYYLYQFWLELLTDGTSLVSVLVSFYYIFKLMRLGRGVELLAIKGGHGPKYIAIAVLFLMLNRLMDLIAEPLIPQLTADVAFALDDPPAALAAIFLALGIRSMYTLYVDASNPATKIR